MLMQSTICFILISSQQIYLHIHLHISSYHITGLFVHWSERAIGLFPVYLPGAYRSPYWICTQHPTCQWSCTKGHTSNPWNKCPERCLMTTDGPIPIEMHYCSFKTLSYFSCDISCKEPQVDTPLYHTPGDHHRWVLWHITISYSGYLDSDSEKCICIPGINYIPFIFWE